MSALVTVNTTMDCKPFGITSVISKAEPKPEDLKKTEDLERLLQSFHIFETEHELKRREKVLEKLNCLAKQWVHDLSVERNFSPAKAKRCGGKIFTFGSYLLGVHHKDADIDAIFVAPKNIERTDFFSLFYNVLQKQPGIIQCRSIEEAFVPVIKMIFEDIEIDLLFARLSLDEIPDNFDLKDDSLLINLDPSSVRSLNGRRNTAEILELVPNVKNFKITLRTIKLWAKVNGIYSNSLGYFGGISWAILVARVCQLYPNAAPSTLIEKFFVVYSNWNWPKPIFLREPSNTDLGFQVWDPRKNLQDRYHLMPIITPSYPQQNSTFNVSISTKKIIVDEICRAAATMDAIVLGKASWDHLFKGPGFFHRYRHYLVLIASANTLEHQKIWRGFVESKLRYFVGQLENHHLVTYPHLNPKTFELYKRKDVSQAESEAFSAAFCTTWYIGLEFARNRNLHINLFDDVMYFVDSLYRQAGDLKILSDKMVVEVRHIRNRDLRQYLYPDILSQSLQKLIEYNNFTQTILNVKKRLSTELVQQKVKRIRSNENLNGSADTFASGYDGTETTSMMSSVSSVASSISC